MATPQGSKIDTSDWGDGEAEVKVDTSEWGDPEPEVVLDGGTQKYDSLFASPEGSGSTIEKLSQPLMSVGQPARADAPDAPAFQGPTPTPVETAVRGFGQGVTSNWYDEGVAKLLTMFPSQDITIGEIVNWYKGGPFPKALRDNPQGKTYEQNLAEIRGQIAAGEEANPTAAVVGEVGGIATQALSPAGRLMGPQRGATGLQRVGQVSRVGALMGGTNAAGRSEAEDTMGVIEDAGEGAATGAVVAPVLDKTLRVAGTAAQKFANSRAFQAMTGKSPATAAADDTAEMVATNEAAGRSVDPGFAKANTELGALQNTQLGEAALAKDVVRVGSGTKGMASRAQQLQDKTIEKMTVLGRQVDEMMGKGSKNYAMGETVVNYADELNQIVQGADDPLAREAGGRALSNINKYVQELGQTNPQGELFGEAGEAAGKASYEKGWRLLKNVQNLAANEKDPLSKWLYERFASEFQRDLMSQTLSKVMDATDDVARFTPAGDKMGGFVATPPGVDPNSIPYRIGQWASKKAPWLNKAVPEAGTGPRSGSYPDVVDEPEWALKLKSAITEPGKTPLDRITLTSPVTGTLGAAKDALTGPRVQSTMAAAADSVADKLQGANPAMVGQTAKAPISPGREAKKIEGVEQYVRASTWENIKSQLQTNPKALGKFAPVLQKAMADGGDQGLRVAHWRLSMNDPEYQQLLKNSQE